MVGWPRLPNIKQEIQDFRLVLPVEESSIAPQGVRTNHDMDPVPPEKRTWTASVWVTYWASDISWQKAASMIQLGLNVPNAIGVTIVGSVILAAPMVLNGAIGVKLRVPFPVAIRSSHGYYFSYFPVVSRVIIAFFWFGIQAWNGGTAMKLMISAIWPSYKNLPNSLPKSAGFTTQQMVSYFLYWLLSFPFLFIHPTKLRWLFLFKAIVCPIVALATMAWCLKQASGGGSLLKQPPTVHGEAFSSAWLLSMTSLIGGYSTVALNIPDFTRYARSNKGQWAQAPILPFFYLVTALFGVLSASATQSFYGKVLWSPLDIYDQLWESRAAVFFCSAAWLLAQFSCNISGNSISAANDLSTLFPKYLNIRRGQIICAIVGGFGMVPWKVLSSGKVFLNFISSYAIVLGPFAGLMTADFYLVKKQTYDVPALYNPHGRYRYAGGFNWRAVITLVVCIGPNLPGVINVLNPAIKIGNIKWIYSVSWLFGYLTSITIYTGLSYLFPAHDSLVEQHISAEDFYAANGRTPSGELISEQNEKSSSEVDKEEGVVAYELPASRV
ncbi:hypothetical protein JCM6882_000076 [Rhodosporidiobolus microsporus]